MSYLKRVISALVVVAAVLVVVGPARLEGPAPKRKIRVLVTVHGHGFDEKVFAAKFGKMADLEYTKLDMLKAAKMLKPGLEKEYDVIAMFDWVKTAEEDNKAFAELLNSTARL